jgi:hypothetical protein
MTTGTFKFANAGGYWNDKDSYRLLSGQNFSDRFN